MGSARGTRHWSRMRRWAPSPGPLGTRLQTVHTNPWPGFLQRCDHGSCRHPRRAPVLPPVRAAKARHGALQLDGCPILESFHEAGAKGCRQKRPIRRGSLRTCAGSWLSTAIASPASLCLIGERGRDWVLPAHRTNKLCVVLLHPLQTFLASSPSMTDRESFHA